MAGLLDGERIWPAIEYLDDRWEKSGSAELPLGQADFELVTHYYNQSAAANGGRADVVLNGKHIAADHVGAFVEDIARGTANSIRPDPWQTDTCMGQWHYSRAVAEVNRYKTVEQVTLMLLDVVSKNGNLMLNIPLRGDGSIDEHEEAFFAGLAKWMDVNGEGVFATRPWKVNGDGPSLTYPRPADAPKEFSIPYSPQDVRFRKKGSTLYARCLEK